ncbi:acyltransferase family protein [Hymenobacter persicinus]|uniref:Acyltransferase n=1 Tax=Hymenobacter persicinus TaxID=2025506 RepID=A0A4V1ZAV7_9BACT|nr:acyltransferase [Hymenobacter persicinus]RYU80475.1 acyltransferase [Hymenobacter persicinus]
MPPLSTDSTTRYAELDGLRFLASLAVVLLHFTYSMPRVAHIGPDFPLLGSIFRYGYLGVNLFFMISGFVVLRSARRKSLPQFIIGRIARLYPVYWLSCGLTFLGLYFSGSQVAGPVSWRQLLFNLTMLHEFFGQPSLNGVYWSLTYELTFCFLVALLIGCRLWHLLFPIILGWLAYTLVAGPLPVSHLFSYVFIPKHSAYFLAGMLFYVLQTRQHSVWQVYAALCLALALALRSDRAERQWAQQLYHDAPLNAWVAAGLIGLFFLAFYLIFGAQWRLPAQPVWSWLGRLTYPLYLLHGLGAVLLGPLNGKVNSYLLLGAALIIVLLVAWAAHVFVEQPLGRRLGQGLTHWQARRKAAARLPVQV